MGKEPTEALSRILVRIDVIEEKGESKFQYFCEIGELQLLPPKGSNKYLLHPENCMCAAYIKILKMTSTHGDVWLDEIFIAQETVTDLAIGRRLEGPAT
jgi:hypothetical protein